MRKKIVAIEQDFEKIKIKIYVTGKDNFLHTRVIETDVYDLAKLLIAADNISKKQTHQ